MCVAAGLRLAAPNTTITELQLQAEQTLSWSHCHSVTAADESEADPCCTDFNHLSHNKLLEETFIPTWQTDSSHVESSV